MTNLVNDGGAPAVEYILDVSELLLCVVDSLTSHLTVASCSLGLKYRIAFLHGATTTYSFLISQYVIGVIG